MCFGKIFKINPQDTDKRWHHQKQNEAKVKKHNHTLKLVISGISY